jgi:hypothetical protein
MRVTPRCWTIALAGLLLAHTASAQVRVPRSMDYLFTAQTQDARSLWVNPAGLGAVLQASIMGELVVDHAAAGGLDLAQYTVGFNSRGISLGYQHDAFSEFDGTNSTVRVGLARGLGQAAFGASLAFFKADITQRALDLGARYQLTAPLAVAAVIRDIGKPVLRDSVIGMKGVAGFSLAFLDGLAALSGDAQATERNTSGYDMTYRAALSLQAPGRAPMGGLVALDLGSNMKIDRWSIGLSIGGDDRGVALATMLPTAGSTRLQTVSLTGVATRLAPARR